MWSGHWLVQFTPYALGEVELGPKQNIMTPNLASAGGSSLICRLEQVARGNNLCHSGAARITTAPSLPRRSIAACSIPLPTTNQIAVTASTARRPCDRLLRSETVQAGPGLLGFLSALCACGSKGASLPLDAGGSSATDASGLHQDGAADAGVGPDSSLLPEQDAASLEDAGISCGVEEAGSIGSRDSGVSASVCLVQYMERCTDGNMRYVSCACDDAGHGSCGCGVMYSAGGGGSTNETFGGCPLCPSVAQAESICTFPKLDP
jgi:hypothetical protein